MIWDRPVLEMAPRPTRYARQHHGCEARLQTRRMQKRTAAESAGPLRALNRAGTGLTYPENFANTTLFRGRPIAGSLRRFRQALCRSPHEASATRPGEQSVGVLRSSYASPPTILGESLPELIRTPPAQFHSLSVQFNFQSVCARSHESEP